MGKIPYSHEFELFVKLDFKHAEEILEDYNDFYIFNMAQYNSMFHKFDEKFDEDDEDNQKLLELADKKAKAATEHFAALFGNKDFGESSMVGFHPIWYDLQKILLQEFKHKTPIQDSAMNGIAPMLRTTASILLFAGRVVEEMENLGATYEQLSVIKDGFRLLLERSKTEKLDIPTYHKTKANFKKYKKVDQYIDFCAGLFK